MGLLTCLEFFAQLGYRHESKYIQLTPRKTGPYYVQTRNPDSKKYLEKVANMEYSLHNSDSKVYMISDNSFFVTSKYNLLENDYTSEIFYDSKGNPYYVLPRIILALKENAHISDLIKRYSGILVLDSIQKLKGMTTLICNVPTAQNVLTVVAELDTYDEVEWCEPDMICKWKTYDFNPLFPMQYYLQNDSGGQYDINVVPAWEITTGNGNVTVAVIDEGVDPDHEDLCGNVLQGYTIEDTIGYGKIINANTLNKKAHGMACAGIIGAKNNEKGILGVAYGVNILPVNVAPYKPFEFSINGENLIYDGWTTSITDMAYAIQWAASNADILNCSWGFENDIYPITSVIDSAMINGRNGKGCVVIAASGNNYPNNTTVQFPARMDGVISVGAIDRYGSIQYYSQRGNALDLVAPSGNGNSSSDIVTTDRMGILGDNPPDNGNVNELNDTNYTKRFSGTSAACAEVTGVAALMLSVNPNLTVADIRSILQKTARKLPGMNGQNWTNVYGYGLVNAHTAVFASTNHEIVGPKLIGSIGSYSIENLPSGVNVSWSLSDSYYNNGYNLLIPNYPTTGHCLIVRDQNHNLMNDTLKAAIIVNGDTIQTLKKDSLYAYDDFWGQYTSGNLSGTINYTHFFYVKRGVITTITSPNFFEATVSYDSSATIPSDWNFSSTNGILSFTVPSNSSSTPVVINVNDGCGNYYQLYAAPTSMYNFNISNDDNSITITLNENGDSEKGVSLDLPWTVEIRNATTGELMATQSSTSRSATISTLGWPKGIYIIKITIGKEVLTEKFIVK